jgi:glutathione synthase
MPSPQPPRNALTVLLVVDPLDELKPAKDSSIAIFRELARRGHAIWATTIDGLSWRHAEGRGTTVARALCIEPGPAGGAWYAAGAAEARPLAAFSAVLMRKDPPFDGEYLAATHLLSAAEREGARVFNAPRALRDHNEKLALTEFARFTPPTLVTRSMAEIVEFHGEHGDIVVKPLDGMGGSGIFRIRAGDSNRGVILETVTQLGTRTVMAQRYLPEIAEGDKRILVVGGAVMPQSLARIPKAGENRGNLAAGGIGQAQPLTTRDREIAEALAPELDRRGLLLVGLDVIGGYLTEINVTSPTCFVEIEQQTGLSVAAAFVDALERRVAG